MPRTARLIVPGVPHHVTQRGNRRLRTFFCADDYVRYLALMAEWCARSGVEIWAYCLMPNHSHLIAVPESERALRRAIGEAHREYTREINKREGWRGHLWQGRFASYAMDERHTLAAARYIELNPVRAGLVTSPAEHVWSSARAHLLGCDDALVRAAPLLGRVGDWRSFLGDRTEPEMLELLRAHATTGMPLGSEAFVRDLEGRLGRVILPRVEPPLANLDEGGWRGAA